MKKYRKPEWTLFQGRFGCFRFHPICRRCRHKCKQSYRVALIRCPRFERKIGPFQAFSEGKNPRLVKREYKYTKPQENYTLPQW